MIAEGQLAHPLEDDEFEFRDVREVDEGCQFLVVARSHGTGTRAMTSSITAFVVRPWLAACGPSQMR